MQTANFTTYDEFLRNVNESKLDEFLARGAKVSEPAEFEKMRAHVLSLYEGVHAKHSFIEHGGAFVDCVPIEEQPGVRAAGGNIAEPPKLPENRLQRGRTPAQQLGPMLRPGQSDSFGNEQFCPPGTIPMRRITLEEMSRFETLDHFFSRGRYAKGYPGTTKAGQPGLRRDAAGDHRYAHANQQVNNNGGVTVLNVWDPNSAPGAFSLSQCWYEAFNSSNQVQTVQSGWQAYPGKYFTTAPVLFIYWTADGYTNTGNYNLDAPAFIQTNNTYVLGGAWPDSSVTGGSDIEYIVGYTQNSSGWFLYLGPNNSIDDMELVGYYPASLWNGTQMANFAQFVDFGGEVAPNAGSSATGQMGSGAFAETGHGNAAYQNSLCYIAAGGDYYTAATLTSYDPSFDYYTIALTNNDPNYGTYFYFGGPGGP